MTEIQGKIDFGSSLREVRVSEGSSYRESTVFLRKLMKFLCKKRPHPCVRPILLTSVSDSAKQLRDTDKIND